MQLAQPRRELLGADRHEDEVVRAHLGVEAGHPPHLDAKQDAGRDQLGALAQAFDGVAAYLEVLARLDQRNVDRPPQLREVISDDLDLVAQTTSNAAGASFWDSFRLGPG